MKCLSLIAVIASFGTGMWAAWLWYLSSQVAVDPHWPKDQLTGVPFAPVDQERQHSDWIVALLKAGQTSAALNAKAAFWTAITVALTTVAAVTGWIASFY